MAWRSLHSIVTGIIEAQGCGWAEDEEFIGLDTGSLSRDMHVALGQEAFKALDEDALR